MYLLRHTPDFRSIQNVLCRLLETTAPGSSVNIMLLSNLVSLCVVICLNEDTAYSKTQLKCAQPKLDANGGPFALNFSVALPMNSDIAYGLMNTYSVERVQNPEPYN